MGKIALLPFPSQAAFKSDAWKATVVYSVPSLSSHKRWPTQERLP